MEIQIKIAAPELAAAIDNLAAAIKLTATARAEISGGELVIPAGTPVTVTDATAEPEKPKRTRKAAKTPESAQEPPREPEAPQPEKVTPAPEKPAEAPQDAPELGAPQYGNPVTAPTIDQIAAAGAKLLDEDANKMSALLDLLGKYGVQAITQLKPEQLAGFAADLRALGAEV